MSEPVDPGARSAAPDPQLVVSLAIVAAMTVLGVTLIGVACWLRNWEVAAAGGVGTIIGALATALNAPTGIASALHAAKPGAPQ